MRKATSIEKARISRKVNRLVVRQRRKRAMQVLETKAEPIQAISKPVVHPSDPDCIFNMNQFVKVCKNRWNRWTNELNAQRWITLESVAQDATVGNVGLLAALETVSLQMQKVVLNQ